MSFYPDFIQILEKLILSRFYPNFFLIWIKLEKTLYPDFIQILSRFLEPHFIQILSG